MNYIKCYKQGFKFFFSFSLLVSKVAKQCTVNIYVNFHHKCTLNNMRSAHDKYLLLSFDIVWMVINPLIYLNK